MSDQEIHALAVAYAKTMLAKSLKEDPLAGGTTEDIRELLKAYFFAVREIEKEYPDIEANSWER